MLLFAFLVGVVAPDQAKAANSTETTADDVKYRDIEDFMHGLGYSDFSKSDGCLYFVTPDSLDTFMIIEISNTSDAYCFYEESKEYTILYTSNEDYTINIFMYYKPEYASNYDNYSCINVYENQFYGNCNSRYVTVKGVQRNYIRFCDYKYFYYSDLDVYQPVVISEYNYGYSTDIVLYESNLFGSYSFEQWCSDAGLTCSASSNESDSVIPFWYEPDSYNYIVRKTLTASSTSGVYQMTMLQKSDGAHYPYYFEVNDIGYLGVAGSFADTSAFTVRNFYYDVEGNGWKYIERFDVSTLPFDNTNVTFDENVVFIYSDTDIYADREASSIWQPASTEYYNVDIPEPEITRVPVGGGSTVGGNAKPGGLLEFLITLITLVWTKLFAVEVPVDGYNISFQSIIIWGSVAGFLIFLGSRLFGGKKG